MATHVIPETAEEAIATIVTLPDDAVEALHRALERAQPAILPQWLVQQIRAEVPLLEKASLEGLLDVLFSASVAVGGKPHADFIDGVVANAVQKGLGGLTEQGPESDRLRSRLSLLFSTLAIVASGKAHRLCLEQKDSLQSARIVTDLRPVFVDSDDMKPVASIIAHSLSVRTVSWSSFGQPAESSHSIALDLDDLHLLKGQIERAIAKEKTLRVVLKSTQLRRVRTSSQDD